MQKLKIRNLLTNDLEVIMQLHKNSGEDFPFPDLLNQLYCCSKVVEDEDENIVGVGVVRLTSESILILNPGRERSVRARAIKLLINRMKRDVKVLGMDETHVFISKSNSKLKTILMRAFGFVECKDKSLYLQF